jgi:hypothetical protein
VQVQLAQPALLVAELPSKQLSKLLVLLLTQNTQLLTYQAHLEPEKINLLQATLISQDQTLLTVHLNTRVAQAVTPSYQ